MKKIIIVGVVILSGVLLWFFLLRTNTPSQAPQPVDILPIVSYDIQSRDGVTSEIMEARFSEFLTEEKSVNAWTEFTHNGQTVSAQEGLSALGTTVEPSINTLLDQHQWQLYKCEDTISSTGAPSLVISLTFALNPNYPSNLYKDQLDYLATWEQTLLTDVRTVLFPKAYFSITPSQISVFRNNPKHSFVGLRETNVSFSGGETGYIGYIFVGDELLIGNNLECLVEAQELLFDTSA